MILQALLAYAEREGLGDADFEPVGVRWLISLTTDGQLAGEPIPLAENPGEKKLRPKRLIRPKSNPDFVSHGRSYFLCDSLERCALFLDDDEKLESRRVNQTYFVGLLREASASSAALNSVVDFLSDPTKLADLHARLRIAKAKTSENATFSVDGVSVLDIPKLKDWWRRKSQQLRDAQVNAEAACLATGKVGAVCRTTGFIKLLGEDTKLISFNKECPAFESFNFSQAANAAIGIEAEEKIRAAFSELIEKANGERLVFNGTIYLHWTRQPVADDPLDLLNSANPEGVRDLLKSIGSGQPQIGLEADAYYCLSLSNVGPRIMVRAWLETTVTAIRKAVARWFDGLTIVDAADGKLERHDFKLWSLLATLVPQKDGKPDFAKLPPQLGNELMHAALSSSPISRTILAAALRRQSLDQRKPDDSRDPRLNPARMGLIRAVLNRLPNQNITMTAQLDPACSDPAYLCGRLFAVFAELQPIALESVNAGVVERFYASASVTPSLVMGRLFRNAQNHLSKADGRGGWRAGAAENLRKNFEDITTRLGCEFPPTLSLEEQGRFALGFYHQKADYRRISAENRAEREAAANETTATT